MNLKIFQIYYDSISIKGLDPDFIPYDNSKGSSKWFEYGVFRDNYFNKNYKSAEYTGFLSWKFRQKTRIWGKEFVTFIHKAEVSDVYFVNPFQGNTNRFRSVWECGEYFHPGLKEIVKNIFHKIGYDISLDKIVNNHEDTLYCNYWVGNEKFWKMYIEFCEPVHLYIENSLDPILEEKILKQADPSIKASFIPFIMERLFTTLLYVKGKNIKASPLKFHPFFAHPISLYPVYLRLNNLKELEMKGADVTDNRNILLPFLDNFMEMAAKEKQNGILRKIIFRLIFFIKVRIKLFFIKKNLENQV